MSLLLRGIFWNEYEIHKSPGDGHCLSHSVISSLHFQSSVNLTISELIQGIIDETSTKSDFYKDFMKGSLFDLYRGLNAYVNYKVYDTSFGDLVPHIISTAIHVNITIVSGTQNQGYATHRVSCTASETQHDIVIWKAGKHCDGVKSIHPPGSLCGSDKGNFASCEDIKHMKVLWMNICGLSQWKLDDDVLGNHFKNDDIILLQETWSAEKDNFCLSGYTFYNFPREYRHKLSLRNSGGLGVFINHTVCNWVKLVKYTDDIVVWLRLESSFFCFVNDIYVGNVYLVPQNSVYLCHDVFDILRDDMSSFPAHSATLLGGDYNARTNICPDYLDDFPYGSYGDLPVISPVNNKRSTLLLGMFESGKLKRFSKDEARINMIKMITWFATLSYSQ